MKMFLETSLDNLYLCLIDKNDKVINKINIPSLVKKTDVLFENINILFKNINVSINELTDIYTTLGPGSFSGARIGFLFARTISQLSNIKLYVCETYLLFKKQLELSKNSKSEIKIKANKYSVYKIKFSNKKIISTIEENKNDYDIFNYQLFENNVSQFLKIFREVKNPMDIELCYLHEPQIGGIKC
ncbi:tRNA (adenosine(37)-N6)-threonylcarbamoyltransferase complex dimerization subunit type 1 TsaB [Metamycoplasma buccale]|uniref:tRNA (adenosine(37)-N6)-threonylcarbamoyltransferase complex dimerization subunit type 1 TsaB n=1 Tax=Metamycoplasma buccale TaxID=55602 RepID=UPI00398E5D1F